MQYRILRSTKESDLSVEVNNLLERGWKPTGGISTIRLNEETFYMYQAMILDDKIVKEKTPKV